MTASHLLTAAEEWGTLDAAQLCRAVRRAEHGRKPLVDAHSYGCAVRRILARLSRSGVRVEAEKNVLEAGWGTPGRLGLAPRRWAEALYTHATPMGTGHFRFVVVPLHGGTGWLVRTSGSTYDPDPRTLCVGFAAGLNADAIRRVVATHVVPQGRRAARLLARIGVPLPQDVGMGELVRLARLGRAFLRAVAGAEEEGQRRPLTVALCGEYLPAWRRLRADGVRAVLQAQRIPARRWFAEAVVVRRVRQLYPSLDLSSAGGWELLAEQRTAIAETRGRRASLRHGALDPLLETLTHRLAKLRWGRAQVRREALASFALSPWWWAGAIALAAKRERQARREARERRKQQLALALWRAAAHDLVGWRGWNVEGEMLQSPSRRTLWEGAELMAAGISPRATVRSEAGIHACWVREGTGTEGQILGRVRGSGAFVAGLEGWRAETVRIERLWVPLDLDHLRPALRARYGCPVGIYHPVIY